MIFDLEKGSINENYSYETINKLYPPASYQDILAPFKEPLDGLKSDKYLEISHFFSPYFNRLLDFFNEGYFLSDDPFVSGLVYLQSVLNKKNLNVLNFKFNGKKLDLQGFAEKFDFVFSRLGVSFQDLYAHLAKFISYLSVGGILAFIIPSFWFFREDLTDIEKEILAYAKRNDKKWLFVEPIENAIRDAGAEIVSFQKINERQKLSRVEISYLSSMDKLFNADLQNNIAILETIDIPKTDLDIPLSALVVRKKSKTITKDNLFSF
ncbi:MAG TPA: hypothetical protein PLG34_02935 [Spirochaetota bacterium]|jgi:hypothetical protein|nr:MAG: hypothetical protein BWX91_00623 [Spirochaetes bacterium ADurb.Bin133]HNZ27691.1 hypothetical protein [Spirochaetota bacterium]HPY86917.1 hypothetical protein [Spirochaetota bacterium]HQB62428.1 hypothetical protein [Spirochaetota bacterium]